MQNVELDEKTDELASGSDKTPTTYMELLEKRARQRQQQEDLKIQEEIDAVTRGDDDRPIWAQSLGQVVGDTGKIAANAAVSIATDGSTSFFIVSTS